MRQVPMSEKVDPQGRPRILSPQEARRVRLMYSWHSRNGRNQTALAKLFGVSQFTIHKIIMRMPPYDKPAHRDRRRPAP